MTVVLQGSELLIETTSGKLDCYLTYRRVTAPQGRTRFHYPSVIIAMYLWTTQVVHKDMLAVEEIV